MGRMEQLAQQAQRVLVRPVLQAHQVLREIKDLQVLQGKD